MRAVLALLTCLIPFIKSALAESKRVRPTQSQISEQCQGEIAPDIMLVPGKVIGTGSTSELALTQAEELLAKIEKFVTGEAGKLGSVETFRLLTPVAPNGSYPVREPSFQAIKSLSLEFKIGTKIDPILSKLSQLSFVFGSGVSNYWDNRLTFTVLYEFKDLTGLVTGLVDKCVAAALEKSCKSEAGSGECLTSAKQSYYLSNYSLTSEQFMTEVGNAGQFSFYYPNGGSQPYQRLAAEGPVRLSGAITLQRLDSNPPSCG